MNNTKPLHISAAAGQPSTFWQGSSGRWYRSIADARADRAANSVNPEDFVIPRPFWRRRQRLIIAAIAVIGCLLAVYTAYHFRKKLFPTVPDFPKLAVPNLSKLM